MAALISPDLLKRLEQLQLLARRRSKSTAKGERRSGARGQSVEFADYRNYVPGDDLRGIDWNLYGRLDRLFVCGASGREPAAGGARASDARGEGRVRLGPPPLSKTMPSAELVTSARRRVDKLHANGPKLIVKLTL